jgi:hypothetical protein
MPAGGICPQCRNNVSPVAKFCAQCGLEVVGKQARAVWSFAKFLGFFFGIALLVLIVGGGLLFSVNSVRQDAENSQTTAEVDAAAANAKAQREAIAHAHDPWWDPAEQDGLKPVFFGKEYLVGPGEWTSIDVTSSASSGRFKYVVVFEGLDRFRARPDGEAEREYVYPNRQNLQPYQMSGWCRTLLVQPLDEALHRARVKYVRMPRY